MAGDPYYRYATVERGGPLMDLVGHGETTRLQSMIRISHREEGESSKWQGTGEFTDAHLPTAKDRQIPSMITTPKGDLAIATSERAPNAPLRRTQRRNANRRKRRLLERLEKRHAKETATELTPIPKKEDYNPDMKETPASLPATEEEPKFAAEPIPLWNPLEEIFTRCPTCNTGNSRPIRCTAPGSSVPGYLPPEGPALASHHSWNHDFSRATSSEFLRNDLLQSRPGGYAVDGRTGVGSESVPGHIGLPIASGYSALEDPSLLRRDAALGIKPSLTDIERPEAFRKSEGLLLDESNVLSVDGLPRDCTRREVAHLFRPFVGFKEIRVIHKEPRHVGVKGHVLCFVEFDDAKCARTALQAFQGYKFDDKKVDAPVLKVQFAKFPLPHVN